MAKKKSQSSKRSLVIVESPAKAKTINRYLGSGYQVLASMGHVRDLPVSNFGIDLENNFEPVYEILGEKRKTVGQLRKAADKAEAVYLATDLDREGEAIAWHLIHALELDLKQTHRVVFNEITKSAIQAAFEHPHELDLDKVNAQQARRLLDRIVGYQLSPLLQEKMGKGLSAGRVQSVAVRLLVEREKEIRAFVPEESWRITGCFATQLKKAEALAKSWAKFIESHLESPNGPTVKARNTWLSKHDCFLADLISVGGEEFRPGDVAEARAVAEAVGFAVDEVVEREWEDYADKGLKTIILRGRTDTDRSPQFTIRDVQTKRTTSKPNAPFTTATLQQAASTELGFAPARTMRVAQQLYEGVDLGDSAGPVGLITYMRTDSTHLSKDAVQAVRQLIEEEFDKRYLPGKPSVFGNVKRAQEAHEAIRPSDVCLKPETVRDRLKRDQFRLYDMIWRRFVACQMTPSQWDRTTILVGADTARGEAVFRTTGRRLVFDGFLRVAGTANNGGDVLLPETEVGSQVAPLRIDPRQVYSTPPPRYSEASLVKKLEAEGIGRPSTYAAIIQTIQDRGYAELKEKRLHTTPRGEMVTEQLVKHFPKILDVKFTSHMEEELDQIEEAHLDWVRVLAEFYEPFKKLLEKARVEMERPRAEPSEYDCPECGKNMVYRMGRNGRFLSCSGFPECKVTTNIDSEGKPVKTIVSDEVCKECGKPMTFRTSRRGPFLGCSGYPECTFTMPADEHGIPLKKVAAEDIEEECPDCGSPMTVKFSRAGSFLGCSKYPKCKATAKLPPGVYVEKPKPEEAGVRCDKCGRPIVIRTSRRGPFLSCSGFPRCRNAMPLDKVDHLRELEAEGKIPDAPVETNGNGRKNGRKNDVPRDKDGKVDYKAMGPPPEGFAWTRTGRPVVEVWPEDDVLTCPECGGDATVRTGRFGPYFGCTKYPKCSFVANLRGPAKKHAEATVPGATRPKPVPTNIACDDCAAPMVIRQGRSGPFLGCSKYPKCKNSQPLPEGETTESLAATPAS